VDTADADVPAADIPLVMVSLPHGAGPFQMGRVRYANCAMTMLLIGSGSYTHNLWQLSRDGSAPKPGPKPLPLDGPSLAGKPSTGHPDWKQKAPLAGKSPDRRTFQPLLVMMGAASDNTAPVKLHDDWRMGSLSMACWQFD
jgi:4,5-DOPA dioxygenase extradiol